MVTAQLEGKLTSLRLVLGGQTGGGRVDMNMQYPFLRLRTQVETQDSSVIGVGATHGVTG